MVKFLKPGKVVIVTRGRHAGSKAVIVKNYEPNDSKLNAPTSLIVGLQKYPKTVSQKMNLKQLSRRSRLKPYLKVVNHRHFMPTRYSFDLGVHENTVQNMERPEKKKAVKRHLKKVLGKKYMAGQNRWFFTKLRF